MTKPKQPNIIIGFLAILLFGIFTLFVLLPYAVIHDLLNGTLLFRGKCPKCGAEMIPRGFEGHNRRWECPNCGYVIYEESL